MVEKNLQQIMELVGRGQAYCDDIEEAAMKILEKVAVIRKAADIDVLDIGEREMVYLEGRITLLDSAVQSMKASSAEATDCSAAAVQAHNESAVASQQQSLSDIAESQEALAANIDMALARTSEANLFGKLCREYMKETIVPVFVVK
jgi:hypothetical protein